MTTLKSPTGRGGFTLLELLIALSIGSIVVAAVYGAFHTAIKAKERTDAALSPLRNARYVFAALTADARSLYGGSQAGDIVCAEEDCRFPLRRKGAKLFHAHYFVNRKRQFIRETFWKEMAGNAAPEHLEQRILCDDVNKVFFVLEQKSSPPGAMIKLSLELENKPEPVRYENGVLLETPPRE